MKSWHTFVAVLVSVILTATCILVNVLHTPHDESYFRQQYTELVHCIEDVAHTPELKDLGIKSCLP